MTDADCLKVGVEGILRILFTLELEVTRHDGGKVVGEEEELHELEDVALTLALDRQVVRSPEFTVTGDLGTIQCCC